MKSIKTFRAVSWVPHPQLSEGAGLDSTQLNSTQYHPINPPFSIPRPATTYMECGAPAPLLRSRQSTKTIRLLPHNQSLLWIFSTQFPPTQHNFITPRL